METVLDQVIIVSSSILILINIRICYDLAMTLWRKYELDIAWLTVMFGSFIMFGIGGIVAVFVLPVPFTYRVLMVITLILAALGTYNTLHGLNK